MTEAVDKLAAEIAETIIGIEVIENALSKDDRVGLRNDIYIEASRILRAPRKEQGAVSYARIIEIVDDCSERMKATGEGHRMFAKWVSEGINAALYASPNGGREERDERWAQPGDKLHRCWMILYDDPDHGNAYFDGPNAEELAKAQFVRANDHWNCYLVAVQPFPPQDRSRFEAALRAQPHVEGKPE